MRLVLLGPPGAGKGTQANLLVRSLQVPKISTGDIFRQNISEGTELGVQAKQYTDTGRLVPDEVTIAMVAQRLAAPDVSLGFLLDGFPRTHTQAVALEQMLAEQGTQLDAVVSLDVDDDEVVQRLAGRRMCRGCGHIWHVDFAPPQHPGRCDLCGSALYQRPDDHEDTIRHRLQVYAEQTLPLENFYQQRALLLPVAASGSVEQVHAQLQQALEHRPTATSTLNGSTLAAPMDSATH